MSRTQLKKELQNLDKSGIIQVILDLYSARKEAKEYLDFFINPDVDKKMEKNRAAILKELSRGVRWRSKARISVLRGIIRDFASLDPGSDHVAELMVFTVVATIDACTSRQMSATMLNGLRQLTINTVEYLNAHELLPKYLPRLKKAFEALPSRYTIREYLHEALTECASNSLRR